MLIHSCILIFQWLHLLLHCDFRSLLSILISMPLTLSSSKGSGLWHHVRSFVSGYQCSEEYIASIFRAEFLPSRQYVPPQCCYPSTRRLHSVII
jgi:hypothetical protein